MTFVQPPALLFWNPQLFGLLKNGVQREDAALEHGCEGNIKRISFRFQQLAGLRPSNGWFDTDTGSLNVDASTSAICLDCFLKPCSC